MLALALITHLLAISLLSKHVTPLLMMRVTSVALLFAAVLACSGLPDAGVTIYGGLFNVTTATQGMEVLLFTVGALILLAWAPYSEDAVYDSPSVYPTIREYSMIILFTLIGSSLLMSSTDLVSLYIAIELQSFAVYILAALYRDTESATSAGLKYFLLGALSSALILLGAALIYGYSGLTNLADIYLLASVPSHEAYSPLVMGVLLIVVGLLFKVAAAPFHNWAPDVYDGVPTIVTTWLTIMPKIALFVFLLQLVETPLIMSHMAFTSGEDVGTDLLTGEWIKNLLLIASGLSLVIGAVVGLAQTHIKRLLAYSTINHVGFILLALSCIESEGTPANEAFLFYIIQYTLTNLDLFLIILACGYSLYTVQGLAVRMDVSLIRDLAGMLNANKALSLSMAVCFFSMAGIPPMIGFFAKYMVLYTSMATHTYLSLIAILASVISCAYYLRMIKVLMFDPSAPLAPSLSTSSTSASACRGRGPASWSAKLSFSTLLRMGQVHAFMIALLTMTIVLFVLDSSLLLNSVNLMALSFA